MAFAADLKAKDVAAGKQPQTKKTSPKKPSKNNVKNTETIPYYQPALSLVEQWVLADEDRTDEINQLVTIWNAGPPPAVQAKYIAFSFNYDNSLYAFLITEMRSGSWARRPIVSLQNATGRWGR